MINNRYKIKSILGEGRSKVFCCEDIDFPNKAIALKVLPNNVEEDEIKVFRSEYFTLKNLEHPNIISALELGTIVSISSDEEEINIGSNFITLELFEGKELLDFKWNKDENKLESLLIQLCSVLYYLHQSNYIYYDLKPENILIIEEDGKPIIKLIDLGFAKHIINENVNSILGTAEYIAPELLKKEEHDHRVDLYSLGMLLYRIVFEKFPFTTDSQVEIYKAQIEQEFEFPTDCVSEKFINIIKKLVIKSPEERYKSCLEVLADLDVSFENEITKYWMPAKVSTDRTEPITIINKYIEDKDSNEVFAISGIEGSGKTSIINEIYNNFDNTILIKNGNNLSGLSFVKYIIKKIIYNNFIYEKLDEETIDKIESLLNKLPDNLIEELKIIFIKITASVNFLLIIDDYNKFDPFTFESISELIPIFQVNNIKLIITEDADENDLSSKIHNLRKINLSTLTQAQLTSLITRTFHKTFPHAKIKEIILKYADLFPGSIRILINDMLLLNIIQFSSQGVKISPDKKLLDILKSSQDEIYKIRIQKLNDAQLNLCKLISALNISVGEDIISKIIDIGIEDVHNNLLVIEQNEIITQYSITGIATFTSRGLKNYIYNLIEEKEKYHLNIGSSVEEKNIEMEKIELARHFELAQNYKKCIEITFTIIDESEKISAFAYQTKLLEHLVKLPLDEKTKNNIQYKLSVLLNKLSNNKEVLKLMNEIKYDLLDEDEKNNFKIVKGNSFIETGELEEGKKIFESLLPFLKDDEQKDSVLVELARADLDLGNFENSSTSCYEVINRNETLTKEKGKSYGVLGLLQIYTNNNYDEALTQFQKAREIYYKANLKVLATQMENNIGNIYSIKGDYQNAELCWDKALELNKSIGNFNNEAKTSMNNGIYNFEKLNIEKAIKLLNRANSIFLSIGDKLNEGLVQSNLGEVYLFVCEYNKALISISSSITILNELKNVNESLTSSFILGILFYRLGDRKSTKKILEEFKEIKDKESISGINKNNYDYLSSLLNAENKSTEEIIKKLEKNRKEFLENEDINRFFDSSEVIIELLLKESRFEEAYSEAENEILKEECAKNPYLESRRNFLLSEISKSDKIKEIKPTIEYLEELYKFIEDFTITEFTWKVLFGLTEYYEERGNVSKTKEFAKYTRATLEHIAIKISNSSLLNLYLQEQTRKKALDKIGTIQKN